MVKLWPMVKATLVGLAFLGSTVAVVAVFPTVLILALVLMLCYMVGECIVEYWEERKRRG